jgi:hypothetical protein
LEKVTSRRFLVAEEKGNGVRKVKVKFRQLSGGSEES